jgi:hypothetical protein
VARSIHPSRSIWRRHLCTCLVDTPDLRARLATATDDDGWLIGCKISMDELVMVERRGGDDDGDNGEEEMHNLLRIKIVLSPLTL